ncbi:MAG: arginine--tRNA ligase [Candidatus Omnitrophica bacterium]|nr:arginine--tRNA ligase [Candidatus Omnitrophota bacterium]
MDIEKGIKGLLKEAIEKSGDFSALEEMPFITLARPKLKEFGDFSSNIALVIARKIDRPSLEIARRIQEVLQRELNRSTLLREIDRIEVAGPGFLNFFLSRSHLYEVLLEIRKKKKNFGRLNLGKGKKVHIEFVSANPTGPLNVAHARQAAFGDTLANLLQFSGYRVFREYYLNDEGVQIDTLGASVYAKYLELLGIPAEFPVSGYRGKYIDGLARELAQKYGRKFVKAGGKKLSFFSRFASDRIVREIKEELKAFGVNYNRWFSQKRLDKTGKITKALKLLRKKGFLYQKEGAWWLATSKFGDDKDRVAIKSDLKLTYIAPDIAYHQTKYKRGFAEMLNVWGPDHHGYIPRLKAAISALGYDAQCLTVLIVQLVSLSFADKVIPMSTRLGQFVSLRDIIQAVGKDAARFFFLMRKRDSHLHFDLELAKKQSLENPVYYIQYAHARISNILKFAKTAHITRGDRVPNVGGGRPRNLDLSLLNKPQELSLIQTLRKFSAVVESCALNLEPHRITTYLQDLAKDLHHYYEKHKVVTEEPALTQARLVLVDAARVVLDNGLRLLSVSAPEKM